MKIAKFFAGIFGAIGAVLLVGSMGLCLFSLNAPARVGEVPAGAQACAAALETAVAQKAYADLENCIFGQPDLGLSGTVSDPMAAEVWAMMEDNLTFRWEGEYYLEDTTFCRNAVMTYLEVSGITDDLPVRAHALLTQRVEAAVDMAELYDETGAFREDLMDQVLEEALAQSCRENATIVTIPVTVQLIHKDGQWWAVPDQAMLTALSGGLA